MYQLDIVAAARIASAERGSSCVVSVSHRISYDATEATVHFKAGNLVAESLDFVGLDERTCSLTFCMDCSSDITGLAVHLCCHVGSRKTVVAAALSKLSLNVVTGLHDSGISACLSECYLLTELTDAALYVVAEAADTVPDVSQTVVELAELLTEQNLLL